MSLPQPHPKLHADAIIVRLAIWDLDDCFRLSHIRWWKQTGTALLYAVVDLKRDRVFVPGAVGAEWVPLCMKQ